jgi:rSAM/selenodomain-associated transferase 1
MSQTRIIIFAKAPLADFAKTRLAPALGPDGAARLALALLKLTVAEAIEAKLGPVELCVTPSPEHPAWAELRRDWSEALWSDQGTGDLGQRMARAAQRGLDLGTPVLLIGTDCPALDRLQMSKGAQALDTHDMVITPASDGGYVLLGLNQFAPELFADMAWSTETVAAETERRAALLRWHVCVLETLDDIDEPGDLRHLPDQLRRSLPPLPFPG